MLFPCLLINIFRVIVVHLDDTIMVFGSKNNNLFFAGKASPPKNGRKKVAPHLRQQVGKGGKETSAGIPHRKSLLSAEPKRQIAPGDLRSEKFFCRVKTVLFLTVEIAAARALGYFLQHGIGSGSDPGIG